MPLFFLSLLLIVCGQTIWIAARKLIAAPKIKVAKAAKKEHLRPLPPSIATTTRANLPLAPVEEDDTKQDTPAQNPRTKKKVVLGIAITASVIVVLLIINEIFELLL